MMRGKARMMLAALLFWIGALTGTAAAAMGRDAACVSSATGGYHTVGTRWDAVLRQRWVTVASCDHPDRPTLSRQTAEGKPDAQPLRPTDKTREDLHHGALPVVRAGDIVRLWREEDQLRIEIAAVSEESGTLGSSVRVHPLRSDPGEPPGRQLSGVVRGPADVEMR